MKNGHVVYIDSDPTNVAGIFFHQNTIPGKTSLEAATEFAATLSVGSDIKACALDDYTLVENINIPL